MPLLPLLCWFEVEMICLWVPKGPPVLGFHADGKPLLEGCIQMGAVVGKDGADCSCPVAPMPHHDCALIGPVVPCCAVVMCKPFVCVRAESGPTRVCDVGEGGDLEVFPAPIHLFVELGVFG